MYQIKKRNLWKIVLSFLIAFSLLSLSGTEANAAPTPRVLTLNGGDGQIFRKAMSYYETWELPADQFTAPEGKALLGYSTDQNYDSSSSAHLYKPGDTFTMLDQGVTLYAIWVDGVTVTFNTKGGTSIPAQTVAPGGYATDPGTPTRNNGEAFVGWFSNPYYKYNDYKTIRNDKFDFSNTPITADETLTAIYCKPGYMRIVDLTPGSMGADKNASLQFGHTVFHSNYRDQYTTFEYDDYRSGRDNLVIYSDKQYYPLSLKVTPSEGYRFVGWATDGSTKPTIISRDPELMINSYDEFDGSVYSWWAVVVKDERVDTHRLYNPNSHEHFYTQGVDEKDNLVSLGWQYEGISWVSPKQSSTPVYRLYNPNAGDHHYTTNETERDNVVAAGWILEGISWYSDDFKTVPVYRLYNPNEQQAGAHHYTTSEEERNNLIALGWIDEGIGWYGIN